MNDEPHHPGPMRLPGQRPRVLRPGRLASLSLRNRVIKSATFEGMSPGGVPTDALARHHRTLAEGGVGMTTVAYCAVSEEGRTFVDQLSLKEASHDPLRRLCASVHEAGAKVSLQLGHCGFFSRLRSKEGQGPRGPSWAINSYGLSAGVGLSRPMSEDDIQQVIADFAAAAECAVGLGFDALELHMGHGYLLSQFLSPATNRRGDAWGGDLQGRSKIALQVLRGVRQVVGSEVPLLAKINLRDGFPGGLELEEALGFAQMLEAEGIDALVMSGGFTSKSPFYLLRGRRPLEEMIAAEDNWAQRLALKFIGPRIIQEYPFRECFFREESLRFREKLKVPLVLLGGIASAQNMEQAMEDGFDFIALGRALIADPDLVNRLREGRFERTRCTRCNACVAEMDVAGLRCVLD